MLQRRPEETIALLSSTLSATPPHLAAERSILLADLGAAHAMEEEVERACDLLASSLAVGGATDVNRLGRVATIRRVHLSAWPDAPSVRHLDEELRTHALRRPDG
jgi:hypothetical protein